MSGVQRAHSQHDVGSTPLLALAVLTTLVIADGLVTGLLRPMFPGAVHVETLVGMLVLVPILLLSSLWISAALPLRACIAHAAASVVLAWGGFAFGWIVAYRSLVDDMLGLAAGMALISAVVAIPIVWGMRKIRVRVDPTCCPACGYSRRGLAASRCPECGSEFDDEESAGGASTARVHRRVGASSTGASVVRTPVTRDGESQSLGRAIGWSLAGIVAAGGTGALAGVLVERAGIAVLIVTLVILPILLALSIVPASRLRATAAIALIGVTITIEWLACAVGFDLVSGRESGDLVPVVTGGVVLSLVFAASAIVPARLLR